MKTKCMSCGGTMKKMQKGGVTRPIPGQKKPVTRENKITRAMTNGVKSPNLPPLDSKYLKKRSTGLILKDKSKLQEGTYKPTMQTGGFPITAKAAARKVAKGKGMMTYKYGTTDAPGTGNNKGDYVKFAKDQKSNPYGGKSLKGSRSRSVMQKGGAIKKMQLGGIIKGAIKYGIKGAKIGARAGQKNKALTNEAKRLIALEKVAPGSKRKLMDKVMLNQGTSSERKQISNLFDRVSKVERTSAFNKDLKKVGLVSGSLIGGLGMAAKYLSDKDKKKKKK